MVNYYEFTSTIQCTADPGGNDANGQPILGFKSKANQMAAAGCCGSSKKSACWKDISAAVCATPSDYDGSHVFDDGKGSKISCDLLATMTGLTSTSKQCTDEKNDKGDATLKQTTNMMATTYGCCGSTKKSACWVDISASGKLQLSFCNCI